MRIRITRRTAVSADVMDFVVQTTRQRLELEEAKYHNPRYIPDAVKNNLLRWRGMARGQHDVLDGIAGTMHGLPYDKIEVVKYKDEIYLTGLTLPLEMLEYEGDRATQAIGKYDIGPYAVCIPQTAFVNNSYRGCHFIPSRDPFTGRRHPHHTAYSPDDEAKNPLDMLPNTCVGGFGSIALSMINILDYVETLRTWVTYLGRYNIHSPLGRVGDFMRRIS